MNKWKMRTFITAMVIIASIILAFVVIWSINTLFETGIEYTFKTILASYVLSILILSPRYKS